MILNVTSGGNEDYYSLMVHTNSGAEVVVENKYDTYTKTADKIGSAAFCVTEGIWDVTSTKDGESKTVSINVVEDNILDMMFNYSPEFEYDGEYEIINEGGVNWHIKLKTSGTLNFTSLNNAVDGVEVFLVGGGGRGENADGTGGGHGGGGGDTQTGSVTLVRETDYQITIGAGSGETSGFGYTASPGEDGGGNGGTCGLDGIPPDGGDGGNGVHAFGEETYARYGAGGGGGGGAWDGDYGSGGNGGDYGGGKGGNGNSSSGRAGLANTGGGGGGGGWTTGNGGRGGSGIIIIRNKRS